MFFLEWCFFWSLGLILRLFGYEYEFNFTDGVSLPTFKVKIRIKLKEDLLFRREMSRNDREREVQKSAIEKTQDDQPPSSSLP